MYYMKNIVCVDLFCGVGGLTRGLIDAGIDVKKGYDIDEKAKETYEKNNGTKYFKKDISNLTGSEVLDGIDKENNYFLLAGCAPCQPFSRINKKNIENDPRKFLLLEFARIVKETEPDFIFLENVPGLLKNKGKLVFEKFVKNLEDLNYNYDYDVINAKSYGVPQNRTRLILIASKQSKIRIPKSTHGTIETPYKTVKDTIKKYPYIRAGQTHSKIPNHSARNLDEINKKRMKYIKKNGGSRFDLPEELVLECHKNYSGHSDVYGRMKWNDVSPTLTCKCTSISNGRFAHPTQDRGISVREAAALQTFKDNYIFYGSVTDSTKWVGNAVPVKLAENFGKTFISQII